MVMPPVGPSITRKSDEDNQLIQRSPGRPWGTEAQTPSITLRIRSCQGMPGGDRSTHNAFHFVAGPLSGDLPRDAFTAMSQVLHPGFFRVKAVCGPRDAVGNGQDSDLRKLPSCISLRTRPPVPSRPTPPSTHGPDQHGLPPTESSSRDRQTTVPLFCPYASEAPIAAAAVRGPVGAKGDPEMQV